MGMVSCFAAIDSKALASLRSDPNTIADFLYPDDGESEPKNYVDLDKAWHCIHFMLTGSASGGSGPLALAIFGGNEVGDDVGYGPARLLEPQDVTAIAAALEAIDEASFKLKYFPSKMQAADVYLADMCVRDGDEALDYLVQNFHSLVKFYRLAAERKDGAILWVS